MARQAMVTRTVESYDCLILCVNPETDEMTDRVISVSAKCKDDKAILKSIEKAGISGGLKPLYVKSKSLVTKRYGMTEQKFIMEADELPANAPTDEQ